MAALLLATSSMAQTGQKRVVQLPGTTNNVVKALPTTPRKADVQKQRPVAKSVRNFLANHQKASVPKAPWQKKMAPQKVTGGK